MKTILAMPDGNFLAHVSRLFELAKALREKGYRVIFASSGEYLKIPADAGFTVIPDVYTPSPERIMDVCRKGMVNFYDDDILKKSFDADLKIFEEIKPDLVIGDFRLSLSTSCEYCSIPLAITINGAWTNYYAINFQPPEHGAITRLLGKRLAKPILPWLVDAVVAISRKPYNKLRKQLGLNPRKNLWDIMKGDLNLITDLPEYAPTEELPENFHYIGPMIWEPSMPLPEWTHSLDPEKFTIYVTMGSTGDAHMFHQLVDIFKDTNYQCIVTVANITEIHNIPHNFFVEKFLPGGKLMEECSIDLVICHGGNGTIYQAISKGIPLIGIPTMPDQDINLTRVEDLGIGIAVTHLNFKTSLLLDAIEEIRTNPQYRENARKYQAQIESYDPAGKGAELIDTFLNNPPDAVFSPTQPFSQNNYSEIGEKQY